MDTRTFLKQVVTTPNGWFNLAKLNGSGWEDLWYKWPDDIDGILEAAEKYKETGSIYFTAHLFAHKTSRSQDVLPSRTIQADLDYGVTTRELEPTFLVQTSPGRHQGYWLLRDIQSPAQLEQLSKSLTYTIPDCDKHCWPLGHKMRLPGTYNWKYKERPEVHVVSASLHSHKSLSVAQPPASGEELWTPSEMGVDSHRELLARIKGSAHKSIISQYDKRQKDRSDALWLLMCSAFRAGLSRDEVFVLAKHSANNKYADNKYNGERDLARDILRAERAADERSIQSDREYFDAIRKSSGTVQEKRYMISQRILARMRQHGQFLVTSAGEFFIREDTGRPLYVSRRSGYFDSYLGFYFGLNATETEQRFVCAELETYAKEHGRKGTLAQLAYYNKEANSILIHTGGRDILNVSETGTTRTNNGQLGIVFPWSEGSEPFDPEEPAISIDVIFEHVFDHIVGMTPEEGKALVKAWLYFLFFKDGYASRPLLALFGQPGAGKSTTFSRIYAIIYGSGKGLNSITEPEEFDFAVSTDPVVVFDNVDTYTSWLPDKLAQSAASRELKKRKLYTDQDAVVIKANALVGITAHNPRFRREDIVDRLIIINLERIPDEERVTETKIISTILRYRDRIWAGILTDLKQILATPAPTEDEVPRFRIADFALVGLRISRALGFEPEFRSALAKNVKEQTAFNLEEETTLVDALRSWLKTSSKKIGVPLRISELYNELLMDAPNEVEFQKQFPRTLSLGRKLWALQASLRSEFDIEVEHTEGGEKLWSFRPKTV